MAVSFKIGTDQRLIRVFQNTLHLPIGCFLVSCVYLVHGNVARHRGDEVRDRTGDGRYPERYAIKFAVQLRQNQAHGTGGPRRSRDDVGGGGSGAP